METFERPSMQYEYKRLYSHFIILGNKIDNEKSTRIFL